MVTLGTGCEAYFQNLSNTQFGNLEEGRIHKRMRDVVSNESDNYRILSNVHFRDTLQDTFIES